MKNIYVVGDMIEYASFIKDSILVDKLEDADIVLFTGGEDVDPSLYGARKHQNTFSNIKRDMYEKSIFEQIKPNQLVVSICRGSQFICVMNGGKLVQNCYNHAMFGTHGIVDKDGNVYQITSTHHQMQYPYNLKEDEYEVLFTSDYNRSFDYEGDCIDSYEIENNGEPEIVKYTVQNKPVCLAIQGHPEYMNPEAPVVTMLNTLINKTLNSLK